MVKKKKKKKKGHFSIILSDTVIAIWFTVSVNDTFCITIFILTTKKSQWRDICWGLYQRHVFLFIRFVGWNITAEQQYYIYILLWYLPHVSFIKTFQLLGFEQCTWPYLTISTVFWFTITSYKMNEFQWNQCCNGTFMVHESYRVHNWGNWMA